MRLCSLKPRRPVKYCASYVVSPLSTVAASKPPEPILLLLLLLLGLLYDCQIISFWWCPELILVQKTLSTLPWTVAYLEIWKGRPDLHITHFRCTFSKVFKIYSIFFHIKYWWILADWWIKLRISTIFNPQREKGGRGRCTAQGPLKYVPGREHHQCKQL